MPLNLQRKEIPPGLRRHRAIIQKIYRLSRRYYRLYELDKWEVNVEFESRMPVPTPAEIALERQQHQRPKSEASSDNERGAQCSAEWEYRQAKIIFYLDYLEEKGRFPEIDLYVRHEFLHIVIWPLSLLANDLTEDEYTEVIGRVEERLVEDITRWHLWEKVK